MLCLACVGHLWATPGFSLSGASLHDVGNSFPQAVDVGAAEFMVAVEAVFHVGPFIAELEEEGAAAGGVGDGVGGRSIHVRRAAGNGKGEAPLGRVEMGSAAECELDLVTEGADVAGS